MGLRPCMPVPWRREIFSSSVICLRTRSARSSAERAGFIQGWENFVLAAFEEDWARAGRAKANRARARRLRQRDVRVVEIVIGVIVFFRRDLVGWGELYLARTMIPAFAGERWFPESLSTWRRWVGHNQGYGSGTRAAKNPVRILRSWQSAG